MCFNILDFGALADGVTINTKCIQKAIDECAEGGGGKVSVPAGYRIRSSREVRKRCQQNGRTYGLARQKL